MSDPHALLTHPFSLALPHRLTEVSSWHEHIPFAFALVAATRPRVLVELGTHRGDSFGAFCQAVEGLALPTACYAVDTWRGDEHAGAYGEEIFEELRAYHDSRYGRFSRLIRSTFDEARSHFADGSIDLLHIDGLHTREAVAHDFEAWKAKLSVGAVVLFHDINVRERDFGVWSLWQELSGLHPSFAFVHGHGLGLLAVGRQAPAEVLELCGLPEAGQAVIRERFSALGSRVGLMGQLDLATGRLRDAEVRLASSQQTMAQRDQRVGELEDRVAALSGELGQRDSRVQVAENSARLLRERVQAGEGSLRGLQEELKRLGSLVTEGNRGWVDRLVGWIRKNNRVRLARRKARRGELLYGKDPLLSLPGATTVTGHGPIAWLRRKNRARLAKRKARVRDGRPLLPATGPARPWDAPALGAARPAPAAGVPLGLVPATAEESWSAYPRLKDEFVRIRAHRHAAFEPRPCPTVKAPADLVAFARGLALPAVRAPRVSVIVPAFNHLRETLECIASVAAHTPSSDYELIVVDDASSDQSATVLPLVENLRYLRNQANGGFIVSCTRGAEEARGAFLVFLNNDAQVTEGWLPPLLDTFSTFDRVGAVGPKVLYPSGHLQEAGAMINPDLSITMVGLEDDPGKARYGYPREVHYCSGACLLVPRQRFEEVGGFSDELKPAYYEDCDLQLKLRKLGLRTIYQPASVIVHHLSRTSEGLPNATGFKMQQIARNSQWMRERWGDVVDALDEVRLIAFYLPQFHPIRENEFWWGKGFTEWTNVAKALPVYPGHEQPHLPTELGFYDLRVPEVMHEQARLARAHGISGFCYYYYWFHGRRLLEAPIERLLQESPAPLPFCLCWANENWTRRWDGGGGESEVLIGQAHSDEDDEAVIRDLIRFLRHPSYIRVHGKPMLLVYRVGLFPDIRNTAALWREVCRQEGLGEIHLVRVDSFGDARVATHPATHGFDASVEFPPHECGAPLRKPPGPVRDGFRGNLHDYEGAALQSAGYKDAGYLHYRTVIPRWDNTPRRSNGSTIFVNSSPGAYQAWLEEVLAYTREQNVGDDRMVFINAWNEWAEGAHLEPERRYGRSYLEATRDAMAGRFTSRGI